MLTHPSDFEMVFRIVLAGIFGGIIGLERESQNKSAGFRTHILVCIGSALIMLVSVEMFYMFHGQTNADPARIAAQVVSGIGFLGAGTIMREGASVKGLTTAASLWVVAGVGLAVGIGFYFGAALTTGVIFLTLIYLGKVERQMAGNINYYQLILTGEDRPGMLGLVGSYLGEREVNIQNVELKKNIEKKQILIELTLSLPPFVDIHELTYKLSELPGIFKIERDD